VRLRTFGRLELLPSQPDGAAPVAVQPKRLALLTYLALATPRGFQRRDVLLGLFWPDLDTEEARRALRQALHYLRQFLPNNALMSRADEVVGLTEGALWCDALALEDALAAGREAEALELYRGEFLEGFFASEVSPEFEQWMDRIRSELRRRVARAAGALADQEEQAGNAVAAILAGRRAVELAPDDEPVVRRLIALHGRLGDRAGALRTYDNFARRLAEEFGATPSPETVRVIAEIRAGSVPAMAGNGTAAPPTQEVVPPPGRPGAAATPDAAPTQARPRRRNFRAVGVAAAAIAALLAGALGYLASRSPPPAPPGTALIAILPFRTSGAAPELAWLREGMADLLAVKFGGLPDLRAVDPMVVMRGWQRVAGAAGSGITPDGAVEIARDLGAGRVIDGAVVGTPAHLTFTAQLLTAPQGRIAAEASVEGPLDSLSALADRLSVSLLSLAAGTEARRLSSISSGSLPALRAYLAGRAAFRQGHLREAFDAFRDATILDSTFALAAVELVHAAKWVALNGPDYQRAGRLALAGRERLAPAERTLLDALVRPGYTRPDVIRSWRAATLAFPDQADMWYWLGDAIYHEGMLAGLADPFRMASEAFQRGWALDSAGLDSPLPQGAPLVAEPLGHMVEIAQANGDSESVERLVRLGLSADSISAQGWYLRWHRAVARGLPAQRRFWVDSLAMKPEAFAWIHRFIAWTGVGAADYLRSARLMLQQVAVADPDRAELERRVLALNAGRPHEAALAGAFDPPGTTFGLPVREALYWGGDTSVAAESARRMEQYAAQTSARGEAEQLQVRSLCTLAAWRLAHGDSRYAETAVRRLQRVVVAGLAKDDSIALAHYAAVCPLLLEATRATALSLPSARSALDRADSAVRADYVGQSLGSNLVIARAAEAQGDLPFALRAVRRRAGGYGLLPMWYLSSFLREEGRLAALTGDTVGAIRAYRHYLVLRPNPEAEVRPEVAHVSNELATLLKGTGQP
jgi:DNA-binding SARP family transcriptional activator